MIYFETEENENGDDVSKALFTQLYAAVDDGAERDASANSEDALDDDYETEDVTALDSADDILKYLEDSPPKPKAVPPLRQLLPKADGAGEQQVTMFEPETSTPSPYLRQLLAVRSTVSMVSLCGLCGELVSTATAEAHVVVLWLEPRAEAEARTDLW